MSNFSDMHTEEDLFSEGFVSDHEGDLDFVQKADSVSFLTDENFDLDTAVQELHADFIATSNDGNQNSTPRSNGGDKFQYQQLSHPTNNRDQISSSTISPDIETSFAFDGSHVGGVDGDNSTTAAATKPSSGRRRRKRPFPDATPTSSTAAHHHHRRSSRDSANSRSIDASSPMPLSNPPNYMQHFQKSYRCFIKGLELMRREKGKRDEDATNESDGTLEVGSPSGSQYQLGLLLLEQSLHDAKIALNVLLDQRNVYLMDSSQFINALNHGNTPNRGEESPQHRFRRREHLHHAYQRYIRSILSIQYHIINILGKLQRPKEVRLWRYQSEILYDENSELLQMDFSHLDHGQQRNEATSHHSQEESSRSGSSESASMSLPLLKTPSKNISDSRQDSSSSSEYTKSTVPKLPVIDSPRIRTDAFDNLQEMLDLDTKSRKSQLDAKLPSFDADNLLSNHSGLETTDIIHESHNSQNGWDEEKVDLVLLSPHSSDVHSPGISPSSSKRQHSYPEKRSPREGRSVTSQHSPHTPRRRSLDSHHSVVRKRSPRNRSRSHRMSPPSSQKRRKLKPMPPQSPQVNPSPRTRISNHGSMKKKKRRKASSKKSARSPRKKSLSPQSPINWGKNYDPATVYSAPDFLVSKHSLLHAGAGTKIRAFNLHKKKTKAQLAREIENQKIEAPQLSPNSNGKTHIPTAPASNRPANLAPRRHVIHSRKAGSQRRRRMIEKMPMAVGVDKSVHTGPRRRLPPSELREQSIQTDLAMEEEYIISVEQEAQTANDTSTRIQNRMQQRGSTSKVQFHPDVEVEAKSDTKHSKREKMDPASSDLIQSATSDAKRSDNFQFHIQRLMSKTDDGSLLLQTFQKRMQHHLHAYDTGELRKLLSEENEEVRTIVLCAVLVLQCFWRRIRSQRIYQQKLSSIHLVQDRVLSLKEQLSLKSQQQAAQDIQRIWKGFSDRKFVTQSKAARTIQCAFRCKHARDLRKNLQDQLDAAVRIQVSFRSWRAKQTLKELKRRHVAALTIQLAMRSWISKLRVEREKQMQQAAVVIQRSYRCKLARDVLQERRTQFIAARTIQNAYRCKIARNKLNYHKKQNHSASIIQNHFRKYLYIQKASSAAPVIQRAWKNHLFKLRVKKSREMRQQLMQQRDQAALTIQRVYRGHRDRASLKRLNQNVLIITRTLRRLSSKRFLRAFATPKKGQI